MPIFDTAAPKILIYGFEPWADTALNISAELINQQVLQRDMTAIGCSLAGFEFVVLPVHRNALSNYLASTGKSYAGYVGLGSSSTAKRVTIERWFTNEFNGTPVIYGICRGALVPSNIAPDSGEHLALGNSTSAGTFVCNASALVGFELSDGQSGFIHIPKQENSESIDMLSMSVAHSIKAMKFNSLSFGNTFSMLPSGTHKGPASNETSP